MKISRFALPLLPAALLLSASCVQRAVWTISGGFGQEYRSCGQIESDLRALAELRPDIAQLVSLGKTYEGRDIWAIHVGIREPGAKKPEILVVGGQHANEWIGKEVVMNFAERLVEEKGNEEIVALLRRADVWLVPIVNPDGLVYAEKHDRQWRKNRHAFGGDNYGADPNRGYPFMWRVPGESADNPRGEGAGDEPRSRSFRGYPDLDDPSKPARLENEVLALLSLVSDPQRNFVLFLDYHSFSELVLYPPGFTKDAPPDEEAYLNLAGGIADAMNVTRRSSKLLKMLYDIPLAYTYRVRQAGRLYPDVATGGAIDMMYYMYGIWSLAVELPPHEGNFYRRELLYISGQGYLLPPSRILPTCIENWSGFLYACNWALEHDPPTVQTPFPCPRYEFKKGAAPLSPEASPPDTESQGE